MLSSKILLSLASAIVSSCGQQDVKKEISYYYMSDMDMSVATETISRTRVDARLFPLVQEYLDECRQLRGSSFKCDLSGIRTITLQNDSAKIFHDGGNFVGVTAFTGANSSDIFISDFVDEAGAAFTSEGYNIYTKSVLAHEIGHTKRMSHSQDYTSIMASCVPIYEDVSDYNANMREFFSDSYSKGLGASLSLSEANTTVIQDYRVDPAN